MNALTEEAVLPTLHNLILAEVYLSGGPVDVFRLWSEMYERQKTIDVGTLLFVRAIAHLEENGFLQKVSESKSALTEQGRAYLIALLLAGSLSDEALDRLAESGLKLASTGNILDVAPQGGTGVGTESCKSSSRAVRRSNSLGSSGLDCLDGALDGGSGEPESNNGHSR